jgi:allantoin racemase
MTESALATACLLGHRFSIVAISQRISAWYREVVRGQRLHRPAGQHPRLDRPLAGIGNVQAGPCARPCASCATRAVREDGAEVIVLAGAPLAGLARSAARAELPVPVVDGVSRARCAMPKRWSRCNPGGHDGQLRAAPAGQTPSRLAGSASPALLEGNAAR